MTQPSILALIDREKKNFIENAIEKLIRVLVFTRVIVNSIEARILLIWIKLSIWNLTTKFRPGYESFHETCNDRLRTFEAITAPARFHHAEYTVFYMILKMFSVVQVVLGVHTSWRRKWSNGDSTGSLVTSGQPEYYFMSY